MKYAFENGKIVTRAIEYSVSYHCNLSCAGCSHMSPFVPHHFPSLESFEEDLNTLKSGLHTRQIRLLGGEPLLNPDIVSYIKAAKRSGIADNVKVTTNGILLHKMNRDFWEDVDFVEVTLYPSVKLKTKAIQQVEAMARETETKLNFFKNPNFRTTIVTRPHPKDWVTQLIFNTCKIVHRDHCHMLHEGSLYKCAIPPFLPDYLLKMKMNTYDPTIDAFNLHQSKNLFSDLKQFLLEKKSMEACRYCLGYLGRHQKHHFLKAEYEADPSLQKITRRSHLDPIKLVKESINLFWSSYIKN